MISLDFETYSEVDLKKVGAYAYARHPSTEILCAGYQIDDQAPKLWLPGDPIPDEWNEYTNWWAWNAFFEICIWYYVGMRHHDFPPVQINQWRDTMALAAYFGFPLDLFRASGVIGQEPKDKRGNWLISVLCKPVKPTKARPWTRLTPENSPELFEEFYEYCRQDVRAEKSVQAAMPRQQLPDQEQQFWFENLQASMRGVHVDMPLVKALMKIRDQHIKKLSKEMKQIAEGLSPTQPAKLRDILNSGYEFDLLDMKKATLEAKLKEDINQMARRIIEIRLSAAKTSVKKLDAMAKVVSEDSRAHGMTVYYGAHTGRLAGRLIQLHNLPRGSFKVQDVYCEIIRAGLEPDLFEALFDEPMNAISTFIRSCLTATPGKSLYLADFASIEARIVAWWAGCEMLLELFRTGVDVYTIAAENVYGTKEITKDMRALGKMEILGCGFGMGKDRFFESCTEDWGLEVEREITDLAVDTYRSDYPEVPALWYAVDEAVCRSIQNPNKIFPVGPVKFASTGRWLYARLPSGRAISYPMPAIRKATPAWVHRAFEKAKEDPGSEQEVNGVFVSFIDDWWWVYKKGEWFDYHPDDVGKAKKAAGQTWSITYMGMTDTNQWRRKPTWGGSLVENIVQGMARDVMCEADLRTTEAGFDSLFTVHDELVKEHESDERLEEFMELMTIVPDWAEGLPITAEGECCERFKKS
jgi:DNA polymerase